MEGLPHDTQVTVCIPARVKIGVRVNKFKMNYLPVILATVAAMLVSGLWYSPHVFGRQWIALRAENLRVVPDAAIPAWKFLVEPGREVLVGCILLKLIRRMEIVTLKSALVVGFWVWLGFPVSMLIGSSLWDNKPWGLTLIHAGDWFTKMLVMASVITITRWLGPFGVGHDPKKDFLRQEPAIQKT